jgi:hypothetical protein
MCNSVAVLPGLVEIAGMSAVIKCSFVVALAMAARRVRVEVDDEVDLAAVDFVDDFAVDAAPAEEVVEFAQSSSSS